MNQAPKRATNQVTNILLINKELFKFKFHAIFLRVVVTVYARIKQAIVGISASTAVSGERGDRS